MKRVLSVLTLLIIVLAVGSTTNVSAKTLSSSKSKITVEKGKTKSVTITFKKTGDVYWKSKNKRIATASWGKNWNGDKIKLKIKAKKVGTTKIIVTNSKNSEKAVIKVKVKKKNSVKAKIKKALHVPKNATCKITISKKFYWSGGGIYMRHVEVNGTGKYKKYFAMADFTLDYADYKSVFMWDIP